MDALIGLVVLLLAAAPLGFAGAVLATRGPELLASLFKDPTKLGWPVGVQEEDDVRWSWSARETPAPPVVARIEEAAGTTVPVAPVGRAGRAKAHLSSRGRSSSA